MSAAPATRAARVPGAQLKNFRLYRALRVGCSLLWVVPRYVALILRDRPRARRATPRLATTQADWDRVHELAAEQIRQVALALEGVFTKVAQIGGARADILPAPFIDKLSQFHDSVPPRPFSSLLPILERDLGCPIEKCFASVEEFPLAAASLAQVHRATLLDGSEVVIKIQYPEIRRLIPADLTTIRRVADLVQLLQSRVDLRSVAIEVTRFIELELDFRREVDSTERLAGILEREDGVVVPKVFREYCGDHVIVMEFLPGIQITHIAELTAAGHNTANVARKVGGLYGAMIFEHGFFHGDPHPGNLLVLRDGSIGLLDFGLCKELPKGFAGHIAQMMVSAMIGDTPSAFEAADALGFDTDSVRAEHLRSLMLSIIGDSDSEESVFDILSESRIRRIPEDFALVVRTLILLNGLSHRLAPGRRLIQAELIQHLAAGVAADH